MKKKHFKKPYAKKSLGQNFLVDQNIVDKIISILDPKTDETIIEIGAGRGALTEKIITKAKKVLAIEIDRELIPVLRVMFFNDKNFHLIEQDALEIDFRTLPGRPAQPGKTKLVANLPYYISTAILQHLIQYRDSFSQMVLMLQTEVVERITAPPGNKERGFLTVLIEAYFESQKLFDVPPNAFRPIPKVKSSVMRLITKTQENSLIANEVLFRETISLSFMQKRKTIENNLKNAEGNLATAIKKSGGVSNLLEQVEIEKKSRAESLTIEEWIRLVNLLNMSY